MASAVEDMVWEACDAVTRVDHVLAQRTVRRDEEIDQEEVAIEAEVLRLMTLFQPMGSDMRRLCAILKANGDLERIADCAVNIAERAYHLDPDRTDDLRGDLKHMYPIVRQMLHDAVHAYATGNTDVAKKVRSQDEIMDALYGQFIRKMVSEAAGTTSQDIMAARLDVLSVAKNLERIADHTSNISEDVIYLATGQIIRHGPH